MKTGGKSSGEIGGKNKREGKTWKRVKEKEIKMGKKGIRIAVLICRENKVRIAVGEIDYFAKILGDWHP